MNNIGKTALYTVLFFSKFKELKSHLVSKISISEFSLNKFISMNPRLPKFCFQIKRKKSCWQTRICNDVPTFKTINCYIKMHISVILRFLPSNSFLFISIIPQNNNEFAYGTNCQGYKISQITFAISYKFCNS